MGELAHPLEIRGHHLLCLLGFRGLGYGQEFVQKMGEVAEELHSNSTIPIKVLAECDVICASCPHNTDDNCQKEKDSEPRVKNKDFQVLRKLGFEVGEQMPAAKAWARVRKKMTA